MRIRIRSKYSYSMPGQPPFPITSGLKAQSGMSAASFLLTAVPIMLLFMAVVELSNYFLQRYYLSTVLLETARQASVNHANPETIFEVFNRESKAGSKGIGAEFGVADWLIYIESPDYQAFRNFSNPLLPIARRTGLPAIDNDYQQEQMLQRSAGRHSSGQNIFQANTLTLRLIQPHKPLLPGLSALVRQFSSSDPAKQAYFSRGLMTQDLRIDVTMQSHPVLWPDHPSGQVKRQGSVPKVSATTSTAAPPLDTVQDCLSIWCETSKAAPKTSNTEAASIKPFESGDLSHALTAPTKNQTPILASSHVNAASASTMTPTMASKTLPAQQHSESASLDRKSKEPEAPAVAPRNNSFIDLTTSPGSPRSCPAFMCCNPNAGKDLDESDLPG